MRLHEYLQKNNLTQVDIAKLAEVSPSAISKILRYDSGITLNVAVRISRATKGQVSPEELVNDEVLKEPPQKKSPKRNKVDYSKYAEKFKQALKDRRKANKKSGV